MADIMPNQRSAASASVWSVGGDRRHDLDALRGVAMLLGIALHAAIPFVPYRAQSDFGTSMNWHFFGFVHGFRMPVFFLLSGYFTMMLWTGRGSRGLVAHRARRVALPLVIGVATIVPAVRFAFGAADVIAEVDSERSQAFGFSHLWFLWFLLLMVGGFVATASSIQWATNRSELARTASRWLAPAALLALPVLTIVPTVRMVDEVFGPDYSDTIIPNDGVLAYYCAFFAFGALLFDRRTRNGTPLIDAVGRAWKAQLLVAACVLFPLGQQLMSTQWAISSVLQVAFAWTMSFGLLGAFSALMSRKSDVVTWLSDASYWMYLAHLPLVIILQATASRLGLSPLVAAPTVFVISTALLMWSYQRWIRYTPIGTMLNGKRTRPQAVASEPLSV